MENAVLVGIFHSLIFVEITIKSVIYLYFLSARTSVYLYYALAAYAVLREFMFLNQIDFMPTIVEVFDFSASATGLSYVISFLTALAYHIEGILVIVVEVSIVNSLNVVKKHLVTLRHIVDDVGYLVTTLSNGITISCEKDSALTAGVGVNKMYDSVVVDVGTILLLAVHIPIHTAIISARTSDNLYISAAAIIIGEVYLI